MDLHPFRPDQPGSPSCTDCMMGPRHRNHIATTTTEPPPVTRITTRDGREAEAAFRDLWGTNGPRARVFYQLCIANHAGLTDDELMHRPDLADMPQNTVRPRRVELEQAGLVVRLTDADGKIVRRATTSGRAAQVWVISTAARRLIRSEAAAAS